MTKTISERIWLQILSRFGMDAFWTILSENSDPDGIRFVSTLEAKDYPFYAIQVHTLKMLVMMMFYVFIHEKINLDEKLSVPPWKEQLHMDWPAGPTNPSLQRGKSIILQM